MGLLHFNGVQGRLGELGWTKQVICVLLPQQPVRPADPCGSEAEGRLHSWSLV